MNLKKVKLFSNKSIRDFGSRRERSNYGNIEQNEYVSRSSRKDTKIIQDNDPFFRKLYYEWQLPENNLSFKVFTGLNVIQIRPQSKYRIYI